MGVCDDGDAVGSDWVEKVNTHLTFMSWQDSSLSVLHSISTGMSMCCVSVFVFVFYFSADIPCSGEI